MQLERHRVNKLVHELRRPLIDPVDRIHLHKRSPLVVEGSAIGRSLVFALLELFVPVADRETQVDRVS